MEGRASYDSYQSDLGGTIFCERKALSYFDITGFTVHDCELNLSGFNQQYGIGIKTNGSQDLLSIKQAHQFMMKENCHYIVKPLAYSEDSKLFLLPNGVKTINCDPKVRNLYLEGPQNALDFRDDFKIILRDVVEGLATIQSSGYETMSLSIGNIFLDKSGKAAKLAPCYLKQKTPKSTSLGKTLKSMISQLDLSSTSKEIEELLKALPSQVTKKEIFSNPALWTVEERFEFICNLSKRNITVIKDPFHLWKETFRDALNSTLTDNIQGLLRHLRNKLEHVEDKGESNVRMGPSEKRIILDQKLRSYDPLVFVNIQTCAKNAHIFWSP